MRTYRIYKQGIKTVIEVKDDAGNIIDRKEAVGIQADDTIKATPIGENNANLTITNVINGAFTVVRTKKNILNDIVEDLAFSWIRL